MAGLSIPNVAYPIASVIVPEGGPKCILATCDFSNAAEIDIDGSQVIQSGAIEFIQGAYIDNSQNAVAFTLSCTTGQTVVVGPNMQGFFPLLVQNGAPQLVAKMQQQNGRIVPIIFYNVPIMSCSWKTV